MLNVVIVGGGIAGLSAGVSLRRAGHTVTIYERSALNNEVGAAINVPPNASRFLLAWGLDPVATQLVQSRVMEFNDPRTLELVASVSTAKTAEKFGNGAPFYYAHRVDLHNALKSMATDADGPGTPVKIHLRSEVAAYDPDGPSITLASGEVVEGDVVVAADGVHSKGAEAVLGHDNPALPPIHYNCCYRFLIPASAFDDDEVTKFWNEDSAGRMRLYVDNENSRRLVSYPCRDNKVHNFVGIFYDETMKEVKREDYMAAVDKDHLIEKFAGFHPTVLAIISKATEVKRWPLLFRQPVETWRKGRMVLAGDSAHPMLPHQGQGGAQGLEDGIVLGLVLHGATTPAEIETRLAAYEQIRRNRASAIQILSNVGQDQVGLVYNDLIEFLPENEIPTNPEQIHKFNFSHDVVKETIRRMQELDKEFAVPSSFFLAKYPSERDIAQVA